MITVVDEGCGPEVQPPSLNTMGRWVGRSGQPVMGVLGPLTHEVKWIIGKAAELNSALCSGHMHSVVVGCTQ